MITFKANLLAAVALAQGGDDGRDYLGGVCFTEGNRIVATNGHILTAAIDESVYNENSGIFPISKKAISAMKKKDAHNVTIDNGLLTVWSEKVGDYEPEQLHIEPCKEIDGTFPDWKRVVPSMDSDLTPIGSVDGKYMSLISDTQKTAGYTTVSPWITTTNADSVHLVRYFMPDDQKDAIFSCVVPCRHRLAATIPSWVRDTPATAQAAE